RDVQLYRICEDLTEGLIYLMIIFSPWAFGTTQRWSIWIMNAGGYLLGFLLAVKILIRTAKAYSPPNWENALLGSSGRSRHKFLSVARLKRILLLLTAAILGYCFLSAVNAAATHESQAITFVYHQYVKWLPHSFDSKRTWSALWNYFAMACAFWALADWLPGKSGAEERA